MCLYCCIHHTVFIPFFPARLCELLQHPDGPDTPCHVNVTSVGTQYTAILFLRLFHWTEQTLLNTYYVSGTFIAAEDTVVIQMKIVPALTEPRVYG